MLNSANRANEAAVKIITQVLMRDSMFKIVWESCANKEELKKSMIAVIQQQIEEYAGNRPIEPDMKVVLTFNENYSNHKDLYWKDGDGTLRPIEIRRKDGN